MNFYNRERPQLGRKATKPDEKHMETEMGHKKRPLINTTPDIPSRPENLCRKKPGPAFRDLTQRRSSASYEACQTFDYPLP